MAAVKVKLRPSTVPGKAGTIYYQLTHLRQVKQITRRYIFIHKDWDSNKHKSFSQTQPHTYFSVK